VLTKEITWADRRIAVFASDIALLQGRPKAEKERDGDAARAWRQRLEDRPPSMPRLYEKAYGI
jgi:hypothetical protein